ncbi:hypothetical protein J437_LFUL016711 [Ladona fulva]|uniref:Uncharacterized protein n=1 Tax=Ladona fulva TaxID=123851 RepID=A0A8K0KPZ0_LADFU|nr:hypothetical protein J437_LFUL016711 [Ladona fulva]
MLADTIALYGSELWSIEKEDRERIEALEMWIWRRVSWKDKARNEEAIRRVGEERVLIDIMERRIGLGPERRELLRN